MQYPFMPVQTSESLVFRTYPFAEGDLIVSFLTRDLGKLRGVAKRARKPKSPFGAGLQRLSHVRMVYLQRENRELCSLYSCEFIGEPLDLSQNYETGVALDYCAEVSDQLLPAAEANERFFRLLLAVTAYLRGAAIPAVWPAVLYFSLWAVRLSGFLPELRLSAESVEIAQEIMQTPIAALTPRSWSKQTAADLRHLLIQLMEDQMERRLVTVPLLEAL